MDKTTKKFIDWIFGTLDKQSGKTQAGLAAHLGVAHPQITMLKAGKRDLKVREIPVIAEYLEKAPPAWDLGKVDAENSGRKLRSALLAYGVDRDELEQVIRVIGTYVSDDEKSEQTSNEDQPEPASRHRESEPSQ